MAETKTPRKKPQRQIRRIFEPTGRDPACERCELCFEMRHNRCVWGRGPERSDIMLVGIMPGVEEDREGQPWVGIAGDYLKETLGEIGIDFDSLYCTNVLKCTTQRDREAGGFLKASPKQLKECSPYLLCEISTVQPKVILAMGDAPTFFFTGHNSVAAARGGEVEFPAARLTVVPTYNPAYFVRNKPLSIANGQERRFLRDIKKARDIAKGTWKPTQIEVTIADTVDKVKAMFAGMATAKEIVVDIETTGLESFREWARVYCVAVCFEDGHAWVLPWDHPDYPQANGAIRKRFLELLYGKTIIGHNIKFDLGWLSRIYGLDIWKVDFWDTRVASHLLDDNYPKGHPLKILVRDHVNAPNYAFGMKWSEAKRSFTIGRKKIDWEVLLTYCGRDAGYNWFLKKKLAAALVERPNLEAMAKTILFPACRVFCQMELNGIGVDEERLAESRKTIKERIAVLQEELRAEGLDTANMSKKAVVIDWVYQVRGHPIEEKTYRKKEPSVARASLLRFVEADPPIGKLIECMELMKLMGTYLGDPDHPDKKKRSTGWLPLIYKGRMYPRYDQAGTVTGRTSCESPNIQQTANDTRVRSLIVAPPGWSLLNVDFSQIEMRIAAVIAKDTKLIAGYNADVDVHAGAAAHVLGKPVEDVTDQERRRAKARNFGFLFGMRWSTYKKYAFIHYGIVLSDEEAQEEAKFFHDTYPDITRWQKRTMTGIQQVTLQAEAEVRNEAYEWVNTKDIRVEAWPPTVTSPLGRVRNLPHALSKDRRDVESACRMALNSPVQSMASDLAQWALARLFDSDVLRELNFDPPSDHGILNLDEIRVVEFGHDAIMFEVRDDCIEKYKAIVLAVMENLPLDDMGVGYWPVPIKADADVFKHWDVEDIEEGGTLDETGGFGQ